MRYTLPKLSRSSVSLGVARNVTFWPPRSTTMVSGTSGFSATISCMSLNVSIGLPSIESTRSPDWKPAASAALPGRTESTRAVVSCLP